MKAYNIGRRTTFRDYVDMYYLLRTTSVDLSYISNQASKKFVTNGEKDFSTKSFLEQLRYTEDISDKKEAVSKIIEKSIIPADIEEYLISGKTNTAIQGDRFKGTVLLTFSPLE